MMAPIARAIHRLLVVLLVVPVKQTVTYRASFGHVELFGVFRRICG